MQKYLFMLVGLLLTVGLLAGCGDSEPTATPTQLPAAPPTLIPPTVAAATTVIATLTPSSTSAAQPTSQGDAGQGKTFFSISCSACHGPNAKGIKGLGKDMTTSQFIASKSDAELLEFIKQGRPTSDPLNTTGIAMPPKGGNPALTDEQLLDIIAYIRTLQK